MLALDTNILVRLITNYDPDAVEHMQKALDDKLASERECMAG